jgi:nucleoside-diphosphate-sugar epimerase
MSGSTLPAADSQGFRNAAGRKIVVTGAAGLVGQNLIARLRQRGEYHIVAIDKHKANARTLRALHPEIDVIEADMAEPGAWQQSLRGADSIVIGHAQIGGLEQDEFTRNNLTATERLLDAVARHGGCHLVHLSSSVVNSAAIDFYTESKKAQEALVLQSGNPVVVLRPTLMFGWFDRKHVGWLARFMQRAPVFPIPGDGRYLRQPLYAGDLCQIIMACLDRRLSGSMHNISGLERIDYIDLIRAVREAVQARTPIVRIPYALFWLLLRCYALVDKNPPFTTLQLRALVTPDVFEVIDWPAIFGVQATPLQDALLETFRDPRYAAVTLEF